MMIFMKNKVFQPTLIRYSVTAITSRFHRGDRGSTPRIGDIFTIFFDLTSNENYFFKASCGKQASTE